MFNRFKEVIGRKDDEEKEGPRKTSTDLSFLNSKEVEEYKQATKDIR